MHRAFSPTQLTVVEYQQHFLEFLQQVEIWFKESNRHMFKNVLKIAFIIRRKLFFLFIGRNPTKWPANNCLEIMVCSCAMSSNCVWLQIIFCSCVNETTRDRSCVKKGRSLRFAKIFLKKQTRWSNDKTIIELGYRKISWFVIVSQINYLAKPKTEANNWWLICSVATNKSRCFAQLRPIMVN